MVDEITYSDKGYYIEPVKFYTELAFSRRVLILIFFSIKIID